MSASIWSPDDTIPSEAPPDYVYKRIWIDIAAGQTLVDFASVDPTFVYTPGLQSLEVGIDGGMPLQPVVDYTETTTHSITLISTPTDAGRLYAAVGRPIQVSPSGINASLVPYTFPNGTVTNVQALAASTGSSGIGHIASGTGAIARTAQAALRDIVSADGFATLQNALDSGVGFVYAKSQNITTQVTIPAGCTLMGGGAYATIFTVVGSGFDAFVLAGDGSSFRDAQVFSGTQRTSGSAILLTASKRQQSVRNFRMQNQFTGITVSDGCVVSIIEDGEILDSKSTTGTAIDILGGNDTFISRVISDSSGTEPFAGIRIRKTDAVWMTDVDMIRHGTNLLIDPDGSLGQYITWVFGTNCAFDSSVTGPGVKIYSKGGGSIRGIQFLGLWSATNTIGVHITTDGNASASIDGVKLVAPRLLNNAQQGFLCDAGSKASNIEVIEPTVSGNSSSSVGTYAGIKFGDNIGSFKIRGGKSGSCLGFSASHSYGLEIGTGCTDYGIDGIDLRANVTAAVANGSFGSANGRFVNCAGALTRNTGTATIPNGATSVSVSHGLAATPTFASAKALNSNLGGLDDWVGTLGASTFVINTSGAVAGAKTFCWEAEVK